MNLRSVKKSLLYLVVSGGIVKLLTLLSMTLIVNVLGIGDYGKYALIVALVALLGTLFRVHGGQLYQIEVARLVGERKSEYVKVYQGQALRITAYISIASTCAVFTGWLFSSDISTLSPQVKEYEKYVFICLIYVLVNGFKAVFVSTNRGLGRFKTQSKWDVWESGIRTSAVIGLIVIDRSLLSVSLLVMIDICAVALGWILYSMFLSVPLKEGIIGDEHKFDFLELFRQHGIWFALRIVLVELTVNIRLWMIGWLLSFEAIGIYSVAKRVVQAGKIFLPFGLLMNAFLLHNSTDNEGVKRAYKQGQVLSLIVSLFVVIAILFGSFLLIPILMPNVGDNLFLVIGILSIVYLVKAFSYPINSMLGVDRKYKASMISVLSTFVSMLIVLPTFIQLGSVYGAAAEAILGSALGLFVSYYFLRKDRPDYGLFSGVNWSTIQSVSQVFGKLSK